MTDDEKKKLDDTHNIAVDLHRAFMERSSTGEAPLIERMAGVVIVVERSNWAARWMIRIFLFAGSAIGVVVAYKTGGWKP